MSAYIWKILSLLTHNIMVGEMSKIYRLQKNLTLSLRWNLQSAKVSHAFRKLGTISTSYCEIDATLSQLLGEVTGKVAWEKEALGLGSWLCPLYFRPARLCYNSASQARHFSLPFIRSKTFLFNNKEFQTYIKIDGIIWTPPKPLIQLTSYFKKEFYSIHTNT